MHRRAPGFHPGLMTDMYHPDSAYVSWRTGLNGLTTFDLYTRTAPFGGAYLLVAGLEAALEFVQAFFEDGRPVAAICHGPWTLIDAGVAKGRRLTSYHSIQSDLQNAGADWVDEPVVVDNGLVTSRKPSDLPAFNRKMAGVPGN